MHSNHHRALRRALQIALLAGFAGGGAWATATQAPASGQSGASQTSTDAQAQQAQASWRQTMTERGTPSEGCFTADYPSTTWKQVGCSTAPPRAHSVPPKPPRGAHALTAGGSQTTGNGNDYAIKTGTLIRTTTGTFPSVTGVTSERGVGGISGPNEYSLQINSNFDSTTAACNGHSGCTVWEQFIYAPDYASQGQGAVFMQYWLIGYGGSSCPSGFGSDGAGDCYKNSNIVSAPDVPATQLANMKLAGSVVNGGNDTVTFTNGSRAYSATGKDTVLRIAQVWDQSEFNIVGNAGGSQAQFNSGSSVKVKVAVDDGSTATPTCLSHAGTTGETNNLNLGSCTAAGGSTPYIQFTESN